MKSTTTALALIISLMSAPGSVAFAERAPQTTGQDIQAEMSIRQLNTEEVEAFLHKDAQALAGLWSDDLVVTNPLNKFVSKQQVLGMVKSGALQFASYDRQIEYVRVYGDTAIVAGNETVHWSGTLPNAGKTQLLRFTGVWMRQGGRWQQVARHANVVAQP